MSQTETDKAEKLSECKQIPNHALVSLHAEFLARFPAERSEFRCFIDNPDGDDTCVWDADNDYDPEHDCVQSEKGIKKADCNEWKQILISDRYDPDELWEWVNTKLSK